MTNWKAFSIDQLLPHAGQMVLLERVIEYAPESIVTEVVVRADGLFDTAGRVPAWVGIEYMAQTVAALGGLRRRLAGKAIELGFLLGTRRYQCNVDSFVVGATLLVSATRLVQDQGLGVFDCLIDADGVLMKAKLNVYQPDFARNRVITD